MYFFTGLPKRGLIVFTITDIDEGASLPYFESFQTFTYLGRPIFFFMEEVWQELVGRTIKAGAAK
jgi:hypothetical protein